MKTTKRERARRIKKARLTVEERRRREREEILVGLVLCLTDLIREKNK